MKCRVIKAYVDQYDLIEHAVGDEVEVTKKRAKGMTKAEGDLCFLYVKTT